MQRLQDRPRWNPVTVNNPNVGANYSIKNTGVGDWVIVSMAYLFTTSAVAANRVIEWTVDLGGSPYLRFGSSQFDTANVAYHGTGFCGSNQIAGNAQYTPIDFPVYGVYFPYGATLKSVVQNLDAGDQFSALTMMVIELPTGPDIGYMATPPLFAFQGE